MRFILSLVFILALAMPASSRPITAAERVILKAEVTEFMQAFANKDIRRMIATIPPRLLAEIARRSGTTPDKIRTEMTKDVRSSMKGTHMSNTQISTNALDLRRGSASDGALITFTFVPMNFHLRTQGRDFAITSSLLAILDGGQWYFINVEDSFQIEVLAHVYPLFKHVTFPVGDVVEIK